MNLDVDRQRLNRFMSLANRLRAGASGGQRSRSSSSRGSRGSSHRGSQKSDVQVIDDFESDDDDAAEERAQKAKLELIEAYSRTDQQQSGQRSEEQGASEQKVSERHIVDLLSDLEKESQQRSRVNTAHKYAQKVHIVDDAASDQQSQKSVAFTGIQAKHSADLINKDINANE